VYQEAIQVPLIVKAPGPRRSTGRVADWVQLHDVFPLILQSADIEVPQGIQGNVPPDVRHPILVEGRTPREFNAEVGGDWFALIEDGWKYAWSTGGAHQLFNLTEDPRELYDMFVEYPERARKMADTLHEYLAELPQPGPQAPIRVRKRMQARLKSLGYFR
jgi:arylsulfatase A-like enzyme